MVGVIITVVLLGLVASFSPVIIATGASQLTHSRPVARSLAFLIGVAIASALLELMALGLLAGLKALLLGGNDRAIRIGFDLACGILLIAVFLRLRDRPTEDDFTQHVLDAESSSLDESSQPGLKRIFVLGLTLMIFNARAFVLITGAVTQIRALNSWIGVVVLLITLYLTVNLFPNMPLSAYLISPRLAAKIPEFVDWSTKKSEPALAKAKSAKQWLLDDHRDLLAAVTLFAGVLLLARGLWLVTG